MQPGALGEFLFQPGSIEPLAVYIQDMAATLAHKMMVRRQVGLETGTVSDHAHTLDKADFLERPQGAVHGVERHCRDTARHALVEHLRTGVIRSPRQFAVHFLPLMRHAQTGLAAQGTKRRHLSV